MKGRKPFLDLIAIWAVSWWPALNFCAANGETIRRNGVAALWVVAAISLAVCLSGHALYRLSSRKPAVVVFWVVSTCLVFSYSHVRGAGEQLFAAAGLPWPPLLAWVLLAFMVMLALWHLRKDQRVYRAALIFAVAAPSLAASMATVALLRSNIEETQLSIPTPSSRSAPHTPIDVYYILLDTYAGAQSLRRDFGFDNSGFQGTMRALGFRDVSSERSNYLMTSQTLAGIFHLDYPETEDETTWRKPQMRYPALLELASPPPFIAEWRALGYESSFAGGVLSGCPARHMNCLGRGNRGATAYTTQIFLAPTPIGRFLIHLLDAHRDAISPLEESLDSLHRRDAPFFVFAHNLSPHPPFTFDHLCRPREDDEWEPEDIESSRAAYVDAVKCVNHRVAQLMKKILARDPSALIVIQGDHGASFRLRWNTPMSQWTDAAIRERASFLNLVRAPERCARWLDRPLGQVNTARFVLGCVKGIAPEYLPERTYISTYAKGPESGIVREWRTADNAGANTQ